MSLIADSISTNALYVDSCCSSQGLFHLSCVFRLCLVRFKMGVGSTSTRILGWCPHFFCSKTHFCRTKIINFRKGRTPADSFPAECISWFVFSKRFANHVNTYKEQKLTTAMDIYLISFGNIALNNMGNHYKSMPRFDDSHYLIVQGIVTPTHQQRLTLSILKHSRVPQKRVCICSSKIT